VRYFIRWWETLGRAERIVALSLGLGAPVAILNSTVWAIAVAYMTHERTRVALERLRAQVAAAGTNQPSAAAHEADTAYAMASLADCG
jgi:hypothetical protein